MSALTSAAVCGELFARDDSCLCLCMRRRRCPFRHAAVLSSGTDKAWGRGWCGVCGHCREAVRAPRLRARRVHLTHIGRLEHRATVLKSADMGEVQQEEDVA